MLIGVISRSFETTLTTVSFVLKSCKLLKIMKYFGIDRSTVDLATTQKPEIKL